MRKFFYVTLITTLFHLFFIPQINPCDAADRTGSGFYGDRGKRWAFCIGVGDYSDPRIVDLPKSRNDAIGLAGVLRGQGGFNPVVQFTDDLDSKDPHYPTGRNIKRALRGFEKRISPGDMVLFSFSGHGIQDSRGEAFLMPADGKPANIGRTGISLEYVMDFIERTKVKRSIILIDASREVVSKAGVRAERGVYPSRYLRKGPTAIFYASRKGLYSYDHKESEQSVFATFLIRGLRGEADLEYGGDGDGLVNLKEILGYMQGGISHWSYESGKKQIPYLKILDPGRVDLVVTSTEQTNIEEQDREKTVEPVKEEIDQAIVREPDEEQKEKVEVSETQEIKEMEPQESPGGTADQPKTLSPGPEKSTDPSVGAPAPKTKSEIAKGPEGAPESTTMNKHDEISQSASAESAPIQEDREKTEEADTEQEKQLMAPKSPAVSEAQETATESPAMDKQEEKSQPATAESAPSQGGSEKTEDEDTEQEKPVAAEPESPEAGEDLEAAPKIEEAVEQQEAAEVKEIKEKTEEDRLSRPVDPEEVAMAVKPEMEDKPVPEGVQEVLGKQDQAQEISSNQTIAREDVKPTIAYLRSKPRDLSPSDLSSALTRYRFYSTCWSYNGDFCNPDGDFGNYFVDNQNGTITDEATGLMWQKAGSKQTMTWDDALTYVKVINDAGFGGYSDWRLPTAEELASLMENVWMNQDLFIDPKFNRSQRHCWSSDTSGRKKAWKANFHMGFIVDFPRISKNAVRMVRSLPR